MEKNRELPSVVPVVLTITNALLILLVTLLVIVSIGIGEWPLPIDKTAYPSFQFLLGSFLFVLLAFIALFIWYRHKLWIRTVLLLLSGANLLWVLFFQVRFWFLGGALLSMAMFLFLLIEMAIIFGIYTGRKALKFVLPLLVSIALNTWFFLNIDSWFEELTRIK